jgi:hypothetical protein
LLAGFSPSIVDSPDFRRAIPELPDSESLIAQCGRFAEATKRLLKQKLHSLPHVTLQFDRWSAEPHQHFLAVICQGFCNNEPFDCSLGTIELEDDLFAPAIISPKVEELLIEFEVSPAVLLAPIGSDEISLLPDLNTLRFKHEKPAIRWFPCLLDIVHVVWATFLSVGSELYAPLKGLHTTIRSSEAFAKLCVENGGSKPEIPRLTTASSDVYDFLVSIKDLGAQILTFTSGTEIDAATLQRAQALRNIVSWFTVAEQQFEGEAPGVIGDANAILMALGNGLRQVVGDWSTAAKAADDRLQSLKTTYRSDIYEVTAIAARLNPKYYSPGVVEEPLDQLDERILRDLQIFDPAVVRASDVPDGPSGDHADDRLLDFLTNFARNEPEMPAREISPIGLQFAKFQAESSRRQTQLRCSPIRYWNDLSHEWPQLSAYALSILGRPVTAVRTQRESKLSPRIRDLRDLRRVTENVNDLTMIVVNKKISGEVIMEWSEA